MPVSADNSTIVCSPTTVNANGTSETTITVTVNDENSQPLEDSFVGCYGSGSAFVAGGDVATDASGVATFIGTNTVAEAVVFFAEAGGIAPGVPDPDRSTIVCSPDTLPADGSETTITITLRNADNEPLGGVYGEVYSTGVASVGGPSPVTNASGQSVLPNDEGGEGGKSSVAETVQFYTSACPRLFSNDVTFVEP